MGDNGNAYSVLVGKPEGKKSLGTPRQMWEDNIKSSCEHGNKPSGSIKCCEFLQLLRNCCFLKKDSVLWS
jgi:hypothetical protein